MRKILFKFDVSQVNDPTAVLGKLGMLLAGVNQNTAFWTTQEFDGEVANAYVLGYLYGNCSGCHNAQGPLASLGLDFDQRVAGAMAARRHAPLPSALGVPSRFAIPGSDQTLRIAPRRPDLSAVAFRMGSRFPATQMPPLGTRRVDETALALITNWITHDLAEVAAQGEDKK